MKNTLKEKLARGEKPLGTFVNTGSAAVVECLGCTGLDFVILDLSLIHISEPTRP